MSAWPHLFPAEPSPSPQGGTPPTNQAYSFGALAVAVAAGLLLAPNRYDRPPNQVRGTCLELLKGGEGLQLLDYYWYQHTHLEASLEGAV